MEGIYSFRERFGSFIGRIFSLIHACDGAIHAVVSFSGAADGVIQAFAEVIGGIFFPIQRIYGLAGNQRHFDSDGRGQFRVGGLFQARAVSFQRRFQAERLRFAAFHFDRDGLFHVYQCRIEPQG